MKNTEYNLDILGSLISSESFQALADLVGELDLEITGVDR